MRDEKGYYIGVFLLVGGLGVSWGSISSGLVGLLVAVRFGSDGGNDQRANRQHEYSETDDTGHPAPLC